MIIVVKSLILCGIIIVAYTTLECISFFAFHRDIITSFAGRQKKILYASFGLYISICLFRHTGNKPRQHLERHHSDRYIHDTFSFHQLDIHRHYKC